MIHRLTLLALLIVTACTLGPDYETPSYDAPERWTHQEGIGFIEMKGPWWGSYADPQLEIFIQQSLAQNPSLKEAFYRIEEARAEKNIAHSDLLPHLDYNVSYGREKQVSATFLPGQNGGESVRKNTFTSNNLRSTWDAAWEVDLFGRNRRMLESAEAELEAINASYAHVELTLVADVVEAYFDALRYHIKRQSIEASINALNENRELIASQELSGLVRNDATLDAASDLASYRAQLADIVRGEESARARLATLTGQRMDQLDLDFTDQVQLNLSNIHAIAHAPASVIRRRPDVKQAERQLASATAQYGASIAAIFPNLTLSGFFGFQDSSLLGFDWIWGAASGSFLRLLDFGELINNVDAREARREQAFFAFKSTLLDAYADVEIAFVDWGQSAKRLHERQLILGQKEEKNSMTQARVRAGLESHINQNQSIVETHMARMDVADAQYERAVAYARLSKALALPVASPVDKKCDDD